MTKSSLPFTIGEELGRGGFATVFKGQWKNNTVAIKKINKRSADVEKRIKQEIEIHKSLDHPNIVKFFRSYDYTKYYYLILEYCNGESLENVLKSYKHFSESEAFGIIREVVEALKYLHERHIIHRDVTLKNIMFTQCSKCSTHNVIKLIDFGLSVQLRHFDDPKTTMVGTPTYMPPEAVTGFPQNVKFDCWSLGCVLYALLVGHLPFGGKYTAEVHNAIAMEDLDFPDYISKEAIDLLSNLLQKEELNRPSVYDLYDYEFFKKWSSSISRNSKCQNINYNSNDSGRGSLGFISNSNTRSHEKKSDLFDSALCSVNSHDKEYSNKSKYDQNSYNINPNIHYEIHLKTRKNHDCRIPAPLKHVKNNKHVLPDRRNYLADLPLKSNNPVQENLKYYASQECEPYTDNTEKLWEGNRNRLFYSNPSIEQSILSHDDLKHPYSDLKYSAKGNRYKYENSDVLDSYTDERYNEEHKNFCENTSSSLSSTKKSQHYSHSRSSHNKRNNLKISLEKQNSKERIKPLSTKRLPPVRHKMQKSIFTITDTGQIFLEFLKTENRQKFISLVCGIASDGMRMLVYRPKNKIIAGDSPMPIPKNPNEIQYHKFEYLPKKLLEKYLFAKRIVDVFRSRTPKVTYYGTQAKCEMMENSPNPHYQVMFYDGTLILENGNGISIQGKNGEKSLFKINEIPDNSYFKVYKKMKSYCERLEKGVEGIFSKSEIVFPITIGRRPNNSNIRPQNSSKENMFPSTDSSRKSNQEKYALRRGKWQQNMKMPYVNQMD